MQSSCCRDSCLEVMRRPNVGMQILQAAHSCCVQGALLLKSDAAVLYQGSVANDALMHA